MATDSYKLGPGTLSLGTDPDDSEFAMQLTNIRVDPSENVDEGDDLNLFDGTTLEGDDNVTYSYELSGTAVQDLVASGFTAYCWQNKGLTVAFKFVPVTARSTGGTEGFLDGTCRIRPITVGGDVKTRNTTDFTFVAFGVDFTPETP